MVALEILRSSTVHALNPTPCPRATFTKASPRVSDMISTLVIWLPVPQWNPVSAPGLSIYPVCAQFSHGATANPDLAAATARSR